MYRLLFLCALLLSACGRQSDLPERDDAPPGAHRIVALAPHLAELTVSAGGLQYLVGVSAYSDFPEAVARLPVVSDGFRIDAEALLALEPTLVLVWGGGGQAASLALLEELDVPTLSIPGRTLADIPQALQMIGAAIGTQAIADARAVEFRSALAALSAGSEIDVFYQISLQPLYTVGGEHFISELIERCGGHNIFAELDAGAAVVSIEAVAMRDPDVIVHSSRTAEAVTQFWQRWPELAAVKRGNVLPVSGDLVGRPSMRLLEGARAICAALDDARARAAG
ncbi:MAG: ABC transporter substrate-binding protein [Pseudomonadota bacterium]